MCTGFATVPFVLQDQISMLKIVKDIDCLQRWSGSWRPFWDEERLLDRCRIDRRDTTVTIVMGKANYGCSG